MPCCAIEGILLSNYYQNLYQLFALRICVMLLYRVYYSNYYAVIPKPLGSAISSK